MTAATRDAASVLETLRSSNRFVVQQVFKPIANEYRISIPASASDDEGRPLLFVKQKTYRRVLGKFRDRYVFEIGPGLKDVDHRLHVAFAVGLDALQDR